MLNKRRLLQNISEIMALLPDDSKPKPLNAPDNVEIPVENIGVFVREIKKYRVNLMVILIKISQVHLRIR